MSRPLHAVFTELLDDESARQAYAADPSGHLDGAGHSGLPEELVAEAIVSFADTASPEVAEHLAPFVKAHGPVPDPAEPPDGPGLTALDGLDLVADAPSGDAGRDATADSFDPAAVTEPAEPAHAVDDLDFGTGSDLTTSGPAAGADPATDLDAALLDDDLAAPTPGHEGHEDPLFAEPVSDVEEPVEDLDTE